jgi:phosphoribosylformimino-5-aminoimidazole carboxamide ribotide isomerase
MIVFPAIDVKDGKCVRLARGEFDEVTVYSDDPVEMALEFERIGARYLHVVDLDGARLGEPQNTAVISEMAVKLGIPIQLGGGIRSIDRIEILLCKGIERVILGTSAVSDPDIVKKAAESFGNNLAIAVDAKEGMVAIEGWAKTSSFKAVEFAKQMQDIGAKTIIYTDISRDGMLKGPNFKALEEMINAVDIDVIASGGVTSLEDVKKLKDIGSAGVIIGKAIYTGAIDLAGAIAIAEQD